MGKTAKQLLLTSALATFGFAAAANAAVVVTQIGAENTLTFDNNPIGATSGSSIVCDSAYCGGIKWTAPGGGDVSGNLPNNYAEPLGDKSHYLYSGPNSNDLATVTFDHPTWSFNIYWGSIDGQPPSSFENTMTLYLTDMSTLTLTGTDLEFLVGALGSGSHTNPLDNQWLNIAVTGDFQIASFSAASGKPTFEFDMAAPEPSTWAMMGLGFLGLGYAAFRRKAKASRTVAA